MGCMHAATKSHANSLDRHVRHGCNMPQMSRALQHLGIRMSFRVFWKRRAVFQKIFKPSRIVDHWRIIKYKGKSTSWVGHAPYTGDGRHFPICKLQFVTEVLTCVFTPLETKFSCRDCEHQWQLHKVRMSLGGK